MPRRTREIEIKVCALYAAGLGISGVAREVGLGAGTVHSILVAANMPRRPRGRRWGPRTGKKTRGPEKKRVQAA